MGNIGGVNLNNFDDKISNIMEYIAKSTRCTMEYIGKIKNTIDSVMYTSLEARVETQTILQLMVAKNIVTREEVQEMREKVQRNSEDGKLMNKLLAKMAVNSEYKDGIINNLMQAKVLSPESLSESESDILAEMLQREYANKEKDEVMDIVIRRNNGEEVTEEECLKVENFIKKVADDKDE